MASSLKTQASIDGSEICIDTLPPDFFKWVIDMDAAAKEVDLSKEEAHWNQQSIYQVTGFYTGGDKPINAFTPQVISFGPFHHGAEHLKEMEVHKHRALAHFLHRAGLPLEPFVNKLQRILKRLQDSYGQGLDKKWTENPYEFLKMMLLDGFFMIEVLRMNECSDDYATNDPVFSSRMMHLRKPFRRDMLILENQLPLLVLWALLEVENRRPPDDEYINNLVLSYCTGRETFKANLSRRLASHPLELYRMSLLPEDYTIVPFNLIEYRMIENAVELRKSGVRFRANCNSTSLMDINFHPKTGTLKLPVLPVDDGTEHLLLNMIAYEQSHVGAGNEITSYAMFMDALIDTKDDVKLLQKKYIITNYLGSSKDVADLFNRLPKGTAHDPNDSLNLVRYHLSKYYENYIKRTRIWYQYLHNPWKVLPVVALSLVLTLVQTVCSVLSLLRQK